MDSLDPRMNRFDLIYSEKELKKDSLDQLETFEVFVQATEGRTYQHEGIVHAPNEDIAFLFGKEQFSRRYTCTGIWITKSRNVFVTDFTEDGESVYSKLNSNPETNGPEESFEIFHLLKRGKQHKHIARVEAKGYNHALLKAKENLDEKKPVLNIWVIKSRDIFFSKEEDKDIWNTTPEKKFREATDYRGADKIKKFKNERDEPGSN